jgi:hypothetical protein
MKGQGLNDLPHCELERRSSHHKGIFFEVPTRRFSLLSSACSRVFFDEAGTWMTILENNPAN